jgi:glyoxalase/bleomycin resistance protein/dioxygenase superfamily protein
MATLFLENHYQNAYVTRDLDQALAMFRTQYGFDEFKRIEVQVEVETPAGRGTAGVKLALGWVGNLQYELIQPVSGLVDVYREAVSDQHLIRFHHVCMRVHDWDRFRAELDQPVVLSGGTPGHLQFVYVDARDTVGHYLEYCWMTPERWAALGGR